MHLYRINFWGEASESVYIAVHVCRVRHDYSILHNSDVVLS